MSTTDPKPLTYARPNQRPDPWDPDHWEDADRSVRLRDLGHHPIREWRDITWSDCVDCGASLFGPADPLLKLFDGDPMVCVECGCVHSMSVDPNGWDVDGSTNMSGSWTYLRPSALAGLRRIVLAAS